jgi:predicted SnoaL-like aldol condensation-catalyzing enzyme
MNPSSTAAASKALVSQVMDAVFVRRESSVVERHFAKDHVQHNPSFPNGRDAIPGLIGQLAAGFRYEAGMIVAEGDLVMIHGGYTVSVRRTHLDFGSLGSPPTVRLWGFNSVSSKRRSVSESWHSGHCI